MARLTRRFLRVIFSTTTEEKSLKDCFPAKQVAAGNRRLKSRPSPQTVSLVKEATPLAVQTRQVGRIGVTFHGLRAEVQRFGLVLPPPCVGRCNGGRVRDLAMARCRTALAAMALRTAEVRVWTENPFASAAD